MLHDRLPRGITDKREARFWLLPPGQNPANRRRFVVLVITHVEMINVMNNGFPLYNPFPILNGILASESFRIPVLHTSRQTHTEMWARHRNTAVTPQEKSRTKVTDFT